MSRSTLVALSLSALGQSVLGDYMWNGRSTAFNDPYNWEGGVNPTSNNVSEQPGRVSIGKRGSANIQSVVGRGNYYVGSSIVFDGPSTLVLGGSGGATSFNFDVSNNNNPAVFVTDSEVLCPNNWIPDSDSDDSCPIPVSTSSTFSVPSTGDYLIEIPSSQNFAPRFVNPLRASDCVNGAVSTTTTTGATLTMQFMNGNNQPDQNKCRSTIASSSSDDTCPTNLICSQPDDIAALTTITPDQASGEDKGGSTTIIIIVVVAIIVIVAIVLAVVVIVKKQSSSADSSRSIAGGTTSFENPMYDGAEGEDVLVDEDGMYVEPISGGETSGYMDVPAGAEAVGGGGYMDVAPVTGGTGYMDVAPGFDDDFDDQEDV